jgi:hypothetical protein
MSLNHRSVHREFSILVAILLISVATAARSTTAQAGEFVLVREGQPAATIITAVALTDAAAFAAQELQYHVQKSTGATLPIKSDADKVEGTRILVGPNAAANQLGVDPSQFKDQEYVIRFVDNSLILLGKDAPARTNVEKATNWTTASGGKIPPPPWSDQQGTSYAVHDFLERFCSVRWFGPGDLEMVVPKAQTLAVQTHDVRRAPAFPYRVGYVQTPFTAIGQAQANNPSVADMALLWARLRLGGEKYTCSHAFYGFYDRFWQKNPQCPNLFVASHSDWFGTGYSSDTLKRFKGQPPEMCFMNQGFIRQVVDDARAFFDGRGLPNGEPGAGDYFGLGPMDNRDWCRCPVCRPRFDPKRETHPEQEKGYYSNGYASDYWFTFVNKVAREVAKTHPDKFVATLAYADFAYYPDDVRLEKNVSVQMCLHVRNWWAPGREENDLRFYRDWVSHADGRRLYLWNYYLFPDLLGKMNGFHCFPGFSAHTLDRQIKMFARDGIRGMFIDSLSDQVDSYVTFKLLDDPSLDVNDLLEDFFMRYYGAAGGPMKRMYLRIEEIYSTPANYPEEVQKSRDKDFHQTEEMAWKYLGTEDRMAELGKLMTDAEQADTSAVERQRVAIFRKAVWDYMVHGRKMYLAKQHKQP